MFLDPRCSVSVECEIPPPPPSPTNTALLADIYELNEEIEMDNHPVVFMCPLCIGLHTVSSEEEANALWRPDFVGYIDLVNESLSSS